MTHFSQTVENLALPNFLRHAWLNGGVGDLQMLSDAEPPWTHQWKEGLMNRKAAWTQKVIGADVLVHTCVRLLCSDLSKEPTGVWFFWIKPHGSESTRWVKALQG